MIKLDLTGCAPFISQESYSEYLRRARAALQTLDSKSGEGSAFTGWNELPEELSDELLESYREVGRRWALAGIELVVVIGIGGSYLGAKAAITAMRHSFAAVLGNSAAPQVVFAGHNLSEEYCAELMDAVSMRETAVVVISKSGTTTEPAILFRTLRLHLERRYGEDGAARRIVAVTDPSKGVLRRMACEKGYETFPVPDDIGGRFSILTAVGLLPMAIAGLDIASFAAGARMMQGVCDAMDDSNPAIRYAAIRNLLYDSGKKIEMLVTSNPKLSPFSEWWKQLFGESEGKLGRGIFPVVARYTTDLHSIGQYIQEGERTIFETVLKMENSRREVLIEETEDDADALNYLSGMNVEACNEMALEGTRLAHIDGGVPNILISAEQADEYNMGQLVYFFEKSCALSAYMLGVNPFDQPGVEAYKRNMFALLGRPGYEALAEELKGRLR